MAAVGIPAAPRRPGEGVRLFGFVVGHVHMPVSYFLAGEPGQVKAPVTAYLIDHPAGLALFDTGLGRKYERPAGAPLASFIDLEAGDAIDARLAAIGVDPGEIRWIISSHFHADHAGGNAFFPRATVVIQQAEYEFAHANADGQLYDAAEFETGQPLLKIRGEHDLYGDGTVLIFPTLGHTPGHQSARVRTEGGDVVLCGDCCTFTRSLTELKLPEHCHDADQLLASLKALAAMGRRGARIFPSHDPDFWNGIPKGVPIR